MSSRQSGATRDLSHKVDFSPFGRRPLVRDDRFAKKTSFGVNCYIIANIFERNLNSFLFLPEDYVLFLQGKNEPEATAGSVDNGDCATMELDRVLYNGKSKTSAAHTS